MLDNYLRGWQDIETGITRITMRSKGAYKNDLDFLLSEEDDPNKYPYDIEASKYKKVQHMWFSEKIKYLHKKGIIKDSTYALLCFLNRRRNKIHSYEDAFTEIERQAFSVTSSIISWLHILNSSQVGFNEKQRNEMTERSEIQASQILKELKEKLNP